MLREFIGHLSVFSVSLYHDCNVRRTMGRSHTDRAYGF